jgi:hypothetical protein
MADTNRGQMLDTVLTQAAATGNMKAAIAAHGTGLTASDAAVLNSLSPAEVKSAAELKQKLAPLSHAAADNNGGVF